MAAKIMRKMALLALVETVVGTAVVPLAANAMLVSDVTLTPIEGDVVERNNIRPFFGSSGSTLVTEYQKVAFSVEFAGVADRKSTRLNSSHLVISYAVFCLKKKKNIDHVALHQY